MGASGLVSGATEAGVGSAKAQVSTTCVPEVLMILMDCEARTRVAAPRRAGMTWVGGSIMIAAGGGGPERVGVEASGTGKARDCVTRTGELSGGMENGEMREKVRLVSRKPLTVRSDQLSAAYVKPRRPRHDRHQGPLAVVLSPVPILL